MKVALLTQFFPPETFAGANRVAAMAEALAAEVDVEVFTLLPSYPDPAVYAGADLRVDGVRVHRTRAFAPHDRSLVGRALAEQRMALGLLEAARSSRPDVVVASSPGMFLGPAGLALARLHRAPFLWDVRDLTWQYARERATGAAAFAARALARTMWDVARRADVLVAATPGIAEALRARPVRGSVVCVGNTIDAELLQRLDPSPVRGAGRPVVLYAGLVGRAQALGVLCDVAERLPHVDVHVAGDGPELPAIVAEARRRGLGNLVCHGAVGRGELAGLYRRADVLFAQLHAGPLHAATALPSKLFEYMAAGRPIVYGGEGRPVRLLRETGAGLAVPPGAADEIAGAVARLLADPGAARAMGAAGRRYVERLPTRRDEMAALVRQVRWLAVRAPAEPAVAV